MNPAEENERRGSEVRRREGEKYVKGRGELGGVVERIATLEKAKGRL